MNRTSACQEFEVLLSVKSAGALEAAEAERLDGHLAHCPTCRTAAEQITAALRLARLEPPTEIELRVLDGLPGRIMAAWSRSEQRHTRWRWATVGLAVAAAAAAMFLVSDVPHQGMEYGVELVAQEWQAPDLDELWAASASLDGSAEEEVALNDEILDTDLEDTNPF